MMTRLRILSDIHLEFGPFEIQPIGEDILVLAGDIGTGEQGFDWAEEYARRSGIPVIYVAGNHEFYGHDIDRLTERLKERASASRHVDFLDDDSVMHEFYGADGNSRGEIWFGGATLWTDYELLGTPGGSRMAASRGLNDHRLISVDNHPFRPLDALARHTESVGYLTDVAMRGPYSGNAVIVTHHLPSARSCKQRFKGDALNPCFASNLDNLVEKSGAALWIHGHTHCSNDYMIGNTRVISNPAGYPTRTGRENPTFNPELIVEI